MSSLGVVGELVASYLAHREVMCLWQADHQSAHGGVGLHHGRRSEGHSDALESDQLVEDKVDGDVGQTRIAHSRSDALKLLLMQFGDGELLVGRISPDGLSHLLVHTFRTRFCQSVGKGLEEHLVIVVIGEGLSHIDAGGGGKDAYLVLPHGCLRTDEVAQTMTHAVVSWHLLPQHGQMDGFTERMALSAFAGTHRLHYDVVVLAPRW